MDGHITEVQNLKSEAGGKMGIFDEITKGPVVGVEPRERPVESQVDRITREIEAVSPSYLKTYVISKAREFENLRKQYEQQLDLAKDEMRRLGKAADQQNLVVAKEGYKARDREWLEGLKVIPNVQVAVSNGLIDIELTVKLLVERLK